MHIATAMLIWFGLALIVARTFGGMALYGKNEGSV